MQPAVRAHVLQARNRVLQRRLHGQLGWLLLLLLLFKFGMPRCGRGACGGRQQAQPLLQPRPRRCLRPTRLQTLRRRSSACPLRVCFPAAAAAAAALPAAAACCGCGASSASHVSGADSGRQRLPQGLAHRVQAPQRGLEVAQHLRTRKI